MTTNDPAKGAIRMERTGTITYTGSAQTQDLFTVEGGKVEVLYAGHTVTAAWGASGIKDQQFRAELSGGTTNISSNEAVEGQSGGSWYIIDGTTASTGIFSGNEEVGQAAATAGSLILNDGVTIEVVTAGARTNTGVAYFSVRPLTPGARLVPQL